MKTNCTVLQPVFGNAEEQMLQTGLLDYLGQTVARIHILLFVKHSGKVTNYILLFLLSYSSFLGCGLLPPISKLGASSLIEGESGATVLWVKAGRVREKRKRNPDEYNPCLDKAVRNHCI